MPIAQPDPFYLLDLYHPFWITVNFLWQFAHKTSHLFISLCIVSMEYPPDISSETEYSLLRLWWNSKTIGSLSPHLAQGCSDKYWSTYSLASFRARFCRSWTFFKCLSFASPSYQFFLYIFWHSLQVLCLMPRDLYLQLNSSGYLPIPQWLQAFFSVISAP